VRARLHRNASARSTVKIFVMGRHEAARNDGRIWLIF
jgi:hypothetical protein